MAVHQRKIKKSGGPVEIELIAGNRHVFSYRCFVMQRDGSNPRLMMTGNTIDNLPDKMTLPDAATVLAGLFLSLDGLLSPMVVTGNAQQLSIELHIRQDGATVGNGPVVIKGTLKATVPILEFIEL